MTEPIYTQRRTAQYSGNHSSTEYNKRVEENYQDLVYLYNKYNVIDTKLNQMFSRVMTDHIFLSNAVKDSMDRLKALEATEKMMSLYSYSQLTYNPGSSNGLSLAVPASEQLTFNSIYNYVTLPIVSNASFSVLKMYNSVGEQIIPSFFETRVEPLNSIDAPGALIDTTAPYYSLYDRYDRVWKRSVVVDNPSETGALMYFYVRVPANAVDKKVNSIHLSPYPLNSVDILSIHYTQATNPTLSSQDSWKALNSDALYNDDLSAVGQVPPGGWVNAVNSDIIVNSAPLCFNVASLQFENKPITGFRIGMRQKNYIRENNKYVYTYGLSDLDIRVNKYLNTGRIYFRFSAPENQLIFRVNSVTPKIYNVPLSLTELAFSNRVLYPTSANDLSIIPQSGSSTVFIEITLNKLQDDTVPLLSDLIISYE
jgi:hypothetical protein